MEFRTLTSHVISGNTAPEMAHAALGIVDGFGIYEGDDLHQPYEGLHEERNSAIGHKGMEQIIRQLFYGVVYEFNAAGVFASTVYVDLFYFTRIQF